MKKILITLAAAFTLSTPVSAFAADPVFNDEGARVDTSGPTKKLTFDDGEFLDGEVLRLDESVLKRIVRCARGEMTPDEVQKMFTDPTFAASPSAAPIEFRYRSPYSNLITAVVPISPFANSSRACKRRTCI